MFALSAIIYPECTSAPNFFAKLRAHGILQEGESDQFVWLEVVIVQWLQ